VVRLAVHGGTGHLWVVTAGMVQGFHAADAGATTPVATLALGPGAPVQDVAVDPRSGDVLVALAGASQRFASGGTPRVTVPLVGSVTWRPMASAARGWRRRRT
jgi:hypothetical protein